MTQEEIKAALLGKEIGFGCYWEIEKIEQVLDIDFSGGKVQLVTRHLVDTITPSYDEVADFIHKGIYGNAKCFYVLIERDYEQTKAEQVQAILDRTTKDITTIKGLLNDPAIAEMIDEAAKEWLITLRALGSYFKSENEI